MLFDLEEIIANTDSYFFYKRGDEILDKKYKITISTDSINEDENFIYLPQKGSVSGVAFDDIKAYSKEALNKGAKGIFLDEASIKGDREFVFSLIDEFRNKLKFILVSKDETSKMMNSLLFYTRSQKLSKETKVLAVTGSTGKLTTALMLYSILNLNSKAVLMKADESPKTKLPYKLFEIDEDVDYIIVECDGSKKGTLKELSSILISDGVIITRVIGKNLAEFSNVENIAREKLQLLYYVSKDSIAIIEDNPILTCRAPFYTCRQIFPKNANIEVVEINDKQSLFKYKNETYQIPAKGMQNIENAVKVIDLLADFNIDKNAVKKGLEIFKNLA